MFICGTSVGQVVGWLHMEAQYCPFSAAGESAEQQGAPQKAVQPPATPGAPQPHMMRKMTRSNVSDEHKGVLTVTLIGAGGLQARMA